MLQIIETPGSVVIPRRVARVIDYEPSERIPALLTALRENGWADLGFLALVLRKLSSRLEATGQRTLLTQGECDAMLALGGALQPYTHDRASRSGDRMADLASAIQGVTTVVDGLIEREVVPDEMIVLEVGMSVLGMVFGGITETGEFRKFQCGRMPSLGARVLFIARARANFAGCVWTESPWSPV
jgi:hypothetical protein